MSARAPNIRKRKHFYEAHLKSNNVPQKKDSTLTGFTEESEYHPIRPIESMQQMEIAGQATDRVINSAFRPIRSPNVTTHRKPLTLPSVKVKQDDVLSQSSDKDWMKAAQETSDLLLSGA